MVVGSAYADMLIGGGGNDNLRGNVGNDTLDGGAGTADVAQYTSATTGITVNLDTGIVQDGRAARITWPGSNGFGAAVSTTAFWAVMGPISSSVQPVRIPLMAA